MSLSLWVPLPTPGAPTNMILAAFLSFFAVVLKVILALVVGKIVAGGERCGGEKGVRRRTTGKANYNGSVKVPIMNHIWPV
jgi:hypothetical protein